MRAEPLLLALLLLAAAPATGAELKDGDVTPGGSTIIEGRDPGADAARVTVEGVYLDTIEAHLARHFGPHESVFHETASEYVHIDLLPLPPTPGRPFWLVVTAGMSDRAMTVPPFEGAADWDRAELMIALPPDWAPDAAGLNAPDRWYALGALKFLARYPHRFATFFGPGHTIGNWQEGPSIGHDTRMDGFLIDWAWDLPEEACCAVAPDGEVINFYLVTPLNPEEMTFKLDRGAEALTARLRAAGAIPVYRPGRPPVVP